VAKKMPSGTFRLKARRLRELADQAGLQNPHRTSLEAGVSYPTIVKYLDLEGSVDETLHLPSLAGILVDACALAPEKVLRMPMGDLFEYVPNERTKAGR
jgi:hypothetical protein